MCRAAAPGWSKGCTENSHSCVSCHRGRVFAARNVRLEVPQNPVVPLRRWRGTAVPCQRPSLLNRGARREGNDV